MSIEPTCDYCGYSDKFRCKSEAAAAGCEQYREKNRIMAQFQEGKRGGAPDPLPISISVTIEGPRGPITVKEVGETIAVNRVGEEPAYFEESEVEAMIAVLGDILQSRK